MLWVVKVKRTYELAKMREQTWLKEEEDELKLRGRGEKERQLILLELYYTSQHHQY